MYKRQVDLFSGPVQLDAKGNARIKLKVPDFNGTLRAVSYTHLDVYKRQLFAMNELGAHSNKAHFKSARIVGDVIGKYHPHGDTAVYDTIVRMAQDLSLIHI